jgi:hypothetical protein
LVELSSRSIRNNETAWGLTAYRRGVQQGRRVRIFYLRREALAALRERRFLT